MRVRFWVLMPGVRMRPKPPGTSLGKSRGHAPRRRAATSLFNGVRPSTTRRGQGERHSLIKLRERTDCPQLTDVPSDLRVNGARHASRNLMPPSKPISPPQAECACLAEAFGGGGSRTGRSSDTSLYFTRFIRVAGLQSKTRPTSPEARNQDAGSFCLVFTIPPIRPNPMMTSAPATIHT